MPNRRPLDDVFQPRSVAVVGASADPAKRGHQILRALTESGYPGRVYPVNPKGGRIADFEVIPSIADLPEAADLAVLCTPAVAAPDLVRECGARGVAAVVILAVGFAESGDEGQTLQQRLATAGREAGVRILGPNTSGILNLPAGLNLIGARGVRPGGIALLVQSGNMALALMNEVTDRSWEGISICAGLGNELDVGFGEVLEYLGDRDDTRAIIVHLEGLRDARGFLASVARVTPRKPVIVLKGARSKLGARAARSHTGAVAGPYDRFRAGLRQAGAIEVTRTDELLHVAETLANQRSSSHSPRGVAILSDGGGHGTLAADTLTALGTPPVGLARDTRDELRALLGSAAAVNDPVDLAGAADADPRVFGEALGLLADDPAVSAVLLVGLFGGYGVRFSETLTESEIEAARTMVEEMRRRGKGLVVHTLYAHHRSAPLEVLGRAGVPVIGSLDVACRCVAELVQVLGPEEDARAMATVDWPDAPVRVDVGEQPSPDHQDALAESRVLPEPEGRALLETHGLRFDPSEVVDSEADAARAWASIGGDAAMKLVSRHIIHKSDADGVVLPVRSEADARTAFSSIVTGADAYRAAHNLPPEPPRVMVSPLLSSPVAELLVGAARDPGLGPVLTVGAGGIWVELLADVAHRVLPASPTSIRAMLRETSIGRLLDGGRGRSPGDIDAIVGAAGSVASAILHRPEIHEIEINPLFVYSEGAIPVDARVIIR